MLFMVRWFSNLKLILLSVLLVFVSINNTFTQENNISFERFSTDDGLNQTSVLTMYQDKDGFIWLGTYLGLNRYDGTKITSYRYNFINTDDISDMHIRSICPDTAGVLLLGTTTGLNIFFKQTKEFINYSHDPKDSNSLAHNIIYKVLKDSDGDIWLATLGGGLDKMEKIEGNYTDERDVKYRFIHYKPSADKNCISSLYISDLAEDANGNIWIATNNGLNRFDKKNKTFEVFKHEKGNNNSLPINDISKVLIDNNGIVWIGTWGGGLCAYNPNNKRFTRFKHNPSIPFSISHNIISSIYSDKKGNVWAGTWGGGLNKLVFPTDRSYIDVLADTPNEIKFINYKNSSTDLHSLSGNSVYSIFEDKTGFIWVGTDWAGVNRFRLGEERFHHFYAEKKQGNNLVSNVVYSLLLDGPDKLWIGTENGLNVYNRKTNDFILYQNIPGDKKSLSQNLVRTLLKDHENNIWVGTENGLNRYNRNTNEFERLTNIFNESEKGIITSLFESSNHELWIGTYSEGLVRYNLKDKTFKRYMNKPNDSTSLSGNIIWSVIEDSNNAIWVGAGDGGLCRLNKDNETFTQYKHDPDDSTSISNDLVLSLFYDKNNNIWIGTRSGLNKLVNAAENKPEFIHYYKSDGLSSGSISGISEDKDNTFWITTSFGLTNFDPETKTFLRYYKEDGLQDNQFSMNCIDTDTATGEVFIGGINGFNIFKPDEIQENVLMPKSRITGLKLFHQSVEVGEEIDGTVVLSKDICYTNYLELNYRHSVISFEFSALNSLIAKGNQFAYKLEEYDKGWNYVTDQKLATYRNLPPGYYIFKVKAANKNGEWEEEPSSIQIHVKPAWWNTLLFKIAAIILVVYLIISIYRLRIKILKRRQHQLEKMVEKRTEQLSEANVLLEEKQEEITLQNDELLHHRNDLEALVEKRTAELTRAKRKAEESDKLKSAFLANMSHEIRTPMNAIIGFSNLLVEETKNKEEREHMAKMIKNNGDTLLTLINDILDISRIEANQLVLYNESFCLDTEFEEIYSFYTIKNNKNIEIQFISNNNLREKLFVHTDPIRFRQVMNNLISNAVKFTENGYVRFGYILKNNQVEIFVEDTGIGITREEQRKIFQHFYKLENKSKLYEGTGIGLSISRELVKLMGGELKLKSEKGKGSTFYFNLPLSDTDNSQSKKDTGKVKDVKLKDVSIVIAEDEQNNYYLLQKILQKTDADLYWTKNGKETVDFIAGFDKTKRCIVLMDIKMPVMNGIEAANGIKQISKNIPIIAVTAYAQAGDKTRIMQNDFDDYISKPIRKNELLEMINVHYSRLLSL